MADVSFVRKDILGQAAAPPSSVGVRGWLVQNLFGTWLNSILTVVSLVLIYVVLEEVLPWMIQSSWTAASLKECREAIDLAWGESVDGACWAVIRERYLQLIYGFYPLRTLLARQSRLPSACSSRLRRSCFPRFPGRCCTFPRASRSSASGFSGGGSIWTPIVGAAGFAIGFAAFVRRDARLRTACRHDSGTACTGGLVDLAGGAGRRTPRRDSRHRHHARGIIQVRRVHAVGHDRGHGNSALASDPGSCWRSGGSRISSSCDPSASDSSSSSGACR